ncbi:ribonuclease P protein subunit p20 [Drosophila nasuta]|uniref:Ribonuclease P protein subunit p20 n=1 Tax=Drosophila albomicans TaxID=7291 RepID=A0A6P8W9W0_DROAB|nr:ribonuclease P protein subunit p20 [Drosophila albomicans]XP_060661487.1 ribonuclease P protein subunit p20 [Drosophila nasuta]
MMDNSNPTIERGAKPRNNNRRNYNPQRANPNHRVVRKQPPRAAATDNRHNIYITSKTDFRAQQKRCEDLLNSGAKEIYLHCMGYSITRGLNLALRLIQNSEGALSYVINTSTIKLLDELHPLCDEDDLTFRQRNNSALHIKIYNSSLFDIVVPQLPVPANLPAHDQHQPKTKQQTHRKQQQQQQKQRQQK